MTEIEKLVFRDGSAHAVVGMNLSAGRLVLEVAPWHQLQAKTTAAFPEAKITSLDAYADDADDLNMPWDIIGFDCYPGSHTRWRFVLHCAGLEYSFESQWPRIVNGDSPQAAKA